MLRIRQIKISLQNDNDNYIKKQILKSLKINEQDIINYKINKKSLDARKKDNLFYVYELDVELKNEEKILTKNKNADILITPNEEYKIEITGTKEFTNRPIIIGSGPAGLFCAYILAENNYKPLVIERGSSVDERVKIIEDFWKTGKLDKNTNIQFGEGGAGTFSDGKLNTLTKDKENRGKKVFDIFVENGAPEEIKYTNHPHIGTDILRNAVKNIRNKIIDMGGEFRFNTTLTNINLNNNELESIEVNNNEIIKCNSLVLAIGHSARDTFYMLNNYLTLTPKPFAIGVRIEHPQELINKNQYGEFYKYLSPANYKLTYQTSKKRGVYSFCMCPGGFVVNASSEEGHLAINGMSNYKRDEKNANSALVVTVTPNDFGNDPLSGIEYQRKLEKQAYEKGNGNIPLQLYKDFIENKVSKKFNDFTPCMKGNYTFANLNEILPNYITEALKEAIPEFDKKIRGYANENTILSAIESRTSSPVRIQRDENGESQIKGIFPCGEGSGYAGGITTAAMDGIRVAEYITKKYKI